MRLLTLLLLLSALLAPGALASEPPDVEILARRVEVTQIESRWRRGRVRLEASSDQLVALLDLLYALHEAEIEVHQGRIRHELGQGHPFTLELQGQPNPRVEHPRMLDLLADLSRLAPGPEEVRMEVTDFDLQGCSLRVEAWLEAEAQAELLVDALRHGAFSDLSSKSHPDKDRGGVWVEFELVPRGRYCLE